jgi:hypothetical protein
MGKLEISLCSIDFGQDLTEKQDDSRYDHDLDNECQPVSHLVEIHQAVHDVGRDNDNGNIDEIVADEDGCQKSLGFFQQL